jgi:CRISPR-associated protein Csx17
VSWHDGDLTDALNNILIRRILCIENSGAPGWPDWSPRPASLADITAFIEGRTDDTLLGDLLWGLCLLDWEKLIQDERAQECGQPEARRLGLKLEYRTVPSSLYALLRLCFRPARKNEDTIPIVQGIHLHASHGHGAIASELAARRLRGSGRSPLVSRVPMQGHLAKRTAASLIFAISDCDLYALEQYILNQQEESHR